MTQLGLCGERRASEASRDTWQTVREEAVAAIEHDRVMADGIRDTVLQHDNFADALAHRLARKLADYAISIETLEAMLCEALSSDPDIEAAALADLTAVRDRDPACPDLLTPFLFFKGYHALQAYRFGNWLWKRGRQHLARHLQSRSSETFAVDIHPAARLGQGLLLDHGTGLVVGETAVIDDDVSMLQSVTLGGTGKQSGDRHPKIRRGVMIGAGAKILGNIEIGQNARIAAGSVVLAAVPPGVTVAGIPARIVRAATPNHPDRPRCVQLQELSYGGFDYAI
jgi:serine O-acetyltransferase